MREDESEGMGSRVMGNVGSGKIRNEEKMMVMGDES